MPNWARSLAGALRAERGGEMGAQVTRIVAAPVDEARFPAPQKRQAHHVQARRFRHDAAIVADVALQVDYRYVQPGVVGAESGRPDDRPDPRATQIHPERWRCLDARRLGAMRGIDRVAD